MTRRSRSVSACLVCDRLEPLGLPVCPSCGGTRADVADRLLFVLPPRETKRRRQLLVRLATLTGRPSRSEAVDSVARGLRALARIPAAAAPEVVARLEDQGVPVHATRADRAWAAVPISFLFLLAAAAGLGLLAGFRGSVAFLILTPLFVLLVGRSADQHVCTPIYPDQPERSAPPVLIRVLAELPPGQARALIADLSQASREILAAEAILSLPPALIRTFDELLPTAAHAALDLAALDRTLADFEHRTRDGGELPETWHQGRRELEETRARLAGYLLEVTGLVGRLQGMSADGLSSAGARLRELVRELRSGVEPPADPSRPGLADPGRTDDAAASRSS